MDFLLLMNFVMIVQAYWILLGNLILLEDVLIVLQNIKASEILLDVKFHWLFHFRGGLCPSL